MLKEFSENTWMVEQPQKFMGLELGTRMTVVRLKNGSLFVHSPIRPTEELLQKLKGLGEVKYIVAPNLLHHLYFNNFSKNFPNAIRYIAPKLNRKIKSIQFDEILENQKKYPWSNEVSHQLIGGVPWVNEVIFLVKASKTLIVTDMALNIDQSSPFLTRLFFKAIGGYNKFGLSGFEKKVFIKDRKQFYDSMAKVMEWEFDKIMLPHGKPILNDGKAQFLRAFLISSSIS